MIRFFNLQKVPAIAVLIISLSPIVVLFQNCGEGFKSSSENLSSIQSTQSCSFNGAIMPSGASVEAYTSATVPFGITCSSKSIQLFCIDGALSEANAFASCSEMPPSTCNFNGKAVGHGEVAIAYQNSTVPFGQSCVQEGRVCNNGLLSGSYVYGNCSVAAPAACTFNNQNLASGASSTGFTSQQVPFGSNCTSVATQVTCTNGMISPNPSYPTCSVAPPANCSFNGQPVNDSASVVAYQSPTVPFGQSCIQENRICSNGSLSGTYAHASCTVNPGASCIFNNQTLASGSSVSGFSSSTVPFGNTCASVATTVTCTNGVLSPNMAFPTCSVEPAASCTFNGVTVSNNQSVVAYQSGMVPFGQTCVQQNRTCNNGNLSGSYTFSSCNVGAPAACTFNNQPLTSGATATGFTTQQVPFGSTCASFATTVTCTNGMISPDPVYPSCTVAPAANCIFNGQTINHSMSVVAFQSATVPFGQNCTQQIRTCTNGTLSGTYPNSTCTVNPGAPCVFNNQTLASGSSAPAFSVSSVPFGSTCASVATQVTCINGSLSPNTAFATCSVEAPLSCSFNGSVVSHSANVIAYQSATVPFGQTCIQENRTCSNGTLSGSYPYSACTVNPGANCTFNGQTLAHGTSTPAYTSQTVPFGGTCANVSTSVTCNNGVTSPSPAFATCAVEAGAACSFNGVSLNSIPQANSSVTAYLSANVPYGQTCTQQVRTCTNGTLSGTYAFSACTVSPPLPTGVEQKSPLEGGVYRTCAVVNGQLRCWGGATSLASANTSTASLIPVVMPGFESGVTAFANGDGGHSCAIVNNRVKCWGWNGNGQLGTGSASNSILGVVDVVGLPSGTASAVAVGSEHSCAVIDGGVWCWGSNRTHQLGDGTVTNSLVPKQPLGVDLTSYPLSSGTQLLVSRGLYTCAVKSSQAYCWGYLGGGYSNSARNFTGTLNIRSVSIGADSACALAGTDVYCWGTNTYGQLGLSNGSTMTPGLIANVGLARSVVSGGWTNCALLVDGSVKCWGLVMNGSDMSSIASTRTPRYTPEIVGWTSGVQALSMSSSTMCAVVNGGAECLGYNGSAALGDGSLTSRMTKGAVLNLASGLVVSPPVP